MKNVVKLEELGMFVISVYALYFFHQAWWAYLLLLFGPDISLVGYLAGSRAGAFIYFISPQRCCYPVVFGRDIIF